MRKLFFFVLMAGLSALFACQSVKTSEKVSNQEPFIGEQIVLPESFSNQLKSIDVNVVFPTAYRVLDEAQPYVKLMTADGKLISDYLIDKFPFHINLSKKIHSSQLFVDLSIYYCRDDAVGMCLKKNVLYEIKMDEHSAQDHLAIQYQIKDEGY